MLYPSTGLLSLSIPWVCTYLQAFENAGWTQRFTGTVFTGPAKGVPPKHTDWRLPDYT